MVNLVKENNLFFRIKKVGLMNQKKAKKGDRLLFFRKKKTASTRGHFFQKK